MTKTPETSSEKKPDSSTSVPFWRQIFKWLRRAYVGLAVAIGSYVLIVTVLFLMILSEGSSFSSDIPYQEDVIREGDEDTEEIVGVVDISGPMLVDDTSDSLSFSPTIASAERINKVLDELNSRDEVKAVVLRINSPGGTAVAADEIYQKILEVRENKPVVAHFSQVAASGGYYVGAAADSIVAHPDTLTGSIGVIMNLYEISELYEKIGVTANTIVSGEFKDIGSEARELTEEERAQLQDLVDGSYDNFVNAIVAGRGMDESTVRNLGDGRLYSGKQAADVGLVDSLGTFDVAIDEAINRAELDDPRVVEYLDQSFFEALLSTSAVRFFPGLRALDKAAPLQSQSGVLYLMQI